MYKLFSAVILLVAFGNAFGQPSAGVSALDWAKKKCTDIGFKAGTERFGNCVLQLSRNDEADSTAPKQATPPVGERPQTPTTLSLQTFKDCDECPEMVVIPEGKFMMGSNPDPFAKLPITSMEIPQHEVKVNKFSLSKYEITQDEWFKVMGTVPSDFKGRTLPVENISWTGAQQFVEKLSLKTGKSYRLPSEAEWEYAARAGSQNTFPFGENLNDLAIYAWDRSNSFNRTHPVGGKLPNSFGLFDMQGNVWEWVQDCWNENYIGAPIDGSTWSSGDCTRAVKRGGSWLDIGEYKRSSMRYTQQKSIKNNETGLRVARDN